MKASGNSDPATCVQNLLKTIRGEVPYERIKGIDRTLIDKPSGTAADNLAADVEFVVETYEPRVHLSSTELSALTAQTGDFALRARIDNITTT
jgi:phage baseplate assembly protein W